MLVVVNDVSGQTMGTVFRDQAVLILEDGTYAAQQPRREDLICTATEV
jgi:hypothetical protein